MEKSEVRDSGGRRKAWLAWSSGKDSAWALHCVRQEHEFDVVALLTTVNRTHERVAMHAVRESLLEIQAAAAGLPLVKVPIPSPCSNEVYEHAMSEAMTQARAEGVLHVIFGDLFLQDIRSYREKQLSRCGMTPVFPLWGRETRQLAEDRIRLAEPYIDDSKLMGSLLRPGRTVIIDLRDEWIEKDEALGLFVVMLKIFATQKHEMRDFNKLMGEASNTRKIIEETSEVREIIEEVRKISDGLNNHIVPPIREMLKEGENVRKLLKELSNHYENIRRLLHHSHDFSVA